MTTKRVIWTAIPIALVCTPAISESTSRLVIEEIVVTSQKRSENLRDVPLSVSAVDGETLREMNVESMNDLSLMTPNVKFNVTPTSVSINIRGLGTGESRGFEQSVGIVIDGVYYGRGLYLNGGLLDMQRVEILRGPQGTLFGKNTIAGALNISSGSPEEEFRGDFSILGGDYNQQRYNGMVTGPLSDSLAFRAALTFDQKDGYLRNTEQGIDEADMTNLMARAKLRWDALDTLSVEHSFSINDVERRGSGAQLSAATDESLEIYRRADPETETDDTNFQTSKDSRAEGGNPVITTHTLNMEWEAGDFAVTSITGASRIQERSAIDADYSPQPLIEVRVGETYQQYSQELRLVSPPGDIEYVAGLYYFQSNLDGFFIIESAPEGDAAAAEALTGAPPGSGAFIEAASALSGAGGLADKSIKQFDQDTFTAALFGQATWYATDRLSLILGYRYGRERKDMDQSLEHENSGVLFQQLLNEEPYDVSNSRSETDRSPKFSAKFDITDNINIYGTFARGFKSGGFNTDAPRGDVVSYDAEVASTFEIGSKMRLLGGAMTLNVGLFDTDFDNLQVSLFDGTSIYVGNAAAVRTRGFEMDSMLLLAENLVLTLSAGYTIARYTSFPDGPCWADGDNAAGPNPRERDENGTCFQDLGGQRLARAPEWNGSLGVQYHLGLFDWPIQATLGANLMYQDEYSLSLDLDPIDFQQAFTQVNAQLGLRAEDESWSFTIFGRNLSNESIRIEGGDVPLFEGNHYSVPELPRSLSAELRIMW